MIDGLGGFAQTCHRRQRLDGLVLEQVLGGEMDAGLTCTADHLDRDDGVTAQFEEIVPQAHLRELEHILPDRHQLLFQRAARRHVGLLQLTDVRLGQVLAVELAVGGQRQAFEH